MNKIESDLKDLDKIRGKYIPKKRTRLDDDVIVEEIDKVRELIKDKKIVYDHKADMKDKKYTAKISLSKVSNEILPEYIISNTNKYKEWLD